MDISNLYKSTVAAAITLATYIFGVPDMWLTTLVTAIILDYVTGLSRAYIRSELSSKSGLKGIIKKLMYFSIVAVAVIADNITAAGGMVRTAVIGFLIANETLSILENCILAELPVPQILIDVLGNLKDPKEPGSDKQDKEA